MSSLHGLQPEVRGLDDGELARRIAAAGEPPAREEEEELARRYSHRLVYFARNRLSSADEAHDLAQNALLLSLEKVRAGDVREPERIGSFILGVARTLVLSGRRSRARFEDLDSIEDGRLTVDASRRDPIAIDRMTGCLEQLPERERAVIVLSFYGEQSCGEIAESLGLSSSNVIKLPGALGSFDFGGLGVEWKIDREETGGGFSVVHHPMAPHALAAPLHRHHREDEYSYVLEGRLGALLGNDVVVAEPGTWVRKPRGQWHTFWNAGDEPCQIIEVISPGGFEDYFREVSAAWGDLEAFARINAKYALDMDFDSVPGLCERFGLTFPEL